MAAVSAVTAAAIGAGTSLLGGAISANQAKQAARGARNDADRARQEMAAIKANRAAIVNPYANDKDLSGMAKDLSGMITNPYANLGVATQAAEIQMEQSDIALANTLDTLRETGSSAGGATALAQAALQSKKGVAATIEQQEVENERLKAQGEAQKNQAKMSEQQRLQGIQISEGQRLQQNEAAGQQFMFQAKENRTNQDLGYTAGQEQQAMQNMASANEAQAGAWSSAFGSAATALGGMVTPTKKSDRRLKHNINIIGKSNSGLNIYSFEYKDKKYGDGLFQGVMSDEIPNYAIVNDGTGFDSVDYSLLDVEFKKI